MAYNVAKIKTYIESVGKSLADEQKEIPKKIDAARKLARETLEKWKDEVRKPLTEYEEKEALRQAALERDVTELQNVAADQSIRSSAVIRDRLNEVRSQEITEARYAEYFDAATRAKTAAIVALESALTAAEVREKEALELAEFRKAAIEREAKEREDRIAKEAAEAARVAAELHAKKLADEAERKAKADQLAAENRERDLKLQAERAEAEKIAAQQRAERAEAAARAKAEKELADKQAAELAAANEREANKKHRAKINNAAMTAFVSGGLSDEAAKLAVELIAKKLIPAVSIGY